MSQSSEKAVVSDERNSAVFRPGLTAQQVAEYYTQWAENYENDLCKGIYNGPSIAANTVGMLYRDGREQVRILDIACGTGLLGVELYELGFRQMDGLDPAEGMLKMCRAKGIYNRLICDYVGCENDIGIHEDTYDCVVISGGMGESHIPCSAFKEMARLVKQGGYVCIAMRAEYADCVTNYKNDQLEQAVIDLDSAGWWKIVLKKNVPNYAFGKDGIVFVLRVDQKFEFSTQ